MGESVYGIGHYGEKIFLCMDKGIVELDTHEAVVRETYHLSGIKPYSFAEIDEMFYDFARKQAEDFRRNEDIDTSTFFQV